MDELDSILRLYKQFQLDPREGLAELLEEKLDYVRLELGYRFEQLTHLCRIQRCVSRFLDKIESERRLQDFQEDDIEED